MLNHGRLVTFACVVGLASVAFAQTRGAQTNTQPPNIVGKWSGVWSAYNPAQSSVPPKEQCARLEATVVSAGPGMWQAAFEGDCGRPYKYEIKMDGRQAGRAVLFKGTADLGQQDGGVYDWIGRATDREFIGFYTSGFATGTFNLSKTQ